MKIAVATTGNNINEFRECKNFLFFELDKNKNRNSESLLPAKGCAYIIDKVFQLIDLKIETLIVLDIMENDKIVLNNAGIEVVKTNKKDLEEIIKKNF